MAAALFNSIPGHGKRKKVYLLHKNEGNVYAEAPFFNFLLAHGKHALAVLKDERRNLYQDVAGLFDHGAPRPGSYRSRQCHW